MTRLVGVLLFLPVPLVLALLTRQPLGLRTSLATGVLLMATHRLYARPYALRQANQRCLWCARQLAPGATTTRPLRLREPFGESDWWACDEAHHARLGRLLGWARAHATGLRAGILGALLALLAGLSVRAAGWTRGPTVADCVALFQFGVAAAVLPLSILGPRARTVSVEPLPVPFPVHIQALIGTAAVMWLFRLVGAAWLALALTHVAQRLAAL